MGLPSMAGQLGAGYAIPILYVPALFWMHVLALWLLVRPARAPGGPEHVDDWMTDDIRVPEITTVIPEL